LSLGCAAGATVSAVPVGTAVAGIVSVTAPLNTAATVGVVAPAGGVVIGTRTDSAVDPTTPSTVAVIIAGLLPILLGSGTGSEIMSRIAAPMVGGMITAPLLSLFVIPAAYRLMRRRMCTSTFSSTTQETAT
jgi:Cu(I)/Ag(I) efflux system membrane protein CusA/SilA